MHACVIAYIYMYIYYIYMHVCLTINIQEDEVMNLRESRWIQEELKGQMEEQK